MQPFRSPFVFKRLLGEVPLEADGSFFIEVPANIPIQLQLVDTRGMALRTCSWIWVKNHEPRGCIGCHEDGELTPPNRFVEAVRKPPIQLTLPAEKRRTVDFRRHVLPILLKRCTSSAGCHEGFPSRLAGKKLDPVEVYNHLMRPAPNHVDSLARRYIHPGRARTSPLIWHLFGGRTDQAWDRTGAPRPTEELPFLDSGLLSDREKRTLVEWIDLGAHWEAPSHSNENPGQETGQGVGGN
jgi:hypothetical protein